MIDGYRKLAHHKPRIRQDVLYAQTPEGVLFHNADAGFQVASKSAYKLAAALVPHLTGEHTVAELCDGLGDAQREMVSRLVSELLERGLVRDTSLDAVPEPPLAPELTERFAAQLSYIDHHTDSPQFRFATLRGARIAVVGDDAVARWCVSSLVRNGAARVGVPASIDRPDTGFAEVVEEIAELNRAGCRTGLDALPWPVRDWDDLAGFDVVLVSDAGAAPRLVPDLLGAGIPDGVTLLCVTPIGDCVLVGPVMSATRPACWVCATLRFGADRDAAAAADVWSRLAAGVHRPEAVLGGPHAAMVGNLLAYEAFRVVTGVIPADTEGAVIVQRLDSLDAVTEPLLPHPRCPHHGGAEPANLAPPLRRITPGEPEFTELSEADDGDEAQQRLYEAAERLVRPNVGVFTAFDDDQYTQLPLKVARLRVPLGHRQSRAVVAFDVHHLAGARWSALLAAAELHAEHVVVLPVRARSAGAEGPAVAPARLAIASGAVNGADQVAHWTRAVSLLSGAVCDVPAAAVQSFGPLNRAGMCVATSAGSGAGGSIAEALGAGLLSALTYDALDRAMRGSEAVVVDPAGRAADRMLDFLVRSAGHLGLAFELLDLGENEVSGAYVVLARAYDDASDTPLWSVGADFHWRRAAIRALRDLVGTVQVAREFPGAPADPGRRLLAAFDPYTLKATDAAHRLDQRAAGTPQAVLDRIRSAGRDALAVQTGSADLRSSGLSTVRVLLVNGA